jgi:hypothetical protein
MSKKVPDVYAKPFEEITDEKSSGERKLQIDLIQALRKMVNSDVCLTDDQWDELFNDMWNHIDKPDYWTYFLGMVAAINSCRTECSHCTNLVCEKRDPDFPLAEVKRQG